MSKLRLIFVLFFSFVLVGCQHNILINNNAVQDNESLKKNPEVNVNKAGDILKKEETTNNNASDPPKDEQSGDLIYRGTILFGNETKIIDFNKADYDTALQSDKLIILYFYATWCPVCKEEIKNFYEAFNSLSNSDIVGFRVNYNDENTDDDEKALAREYGIAYQHTKVFIKGGKRILKSLESWNKERYLKEIQANIASGDPVLQ